ncbi:helix-turn-helix transcriptional regulator [Haladaptatus salinisoli]|uniref:helix-turn-helix transcriptional regulator n=1 Tax=Haladaptatus salinisoli TaxID=2884876 RepID=UPI001D0A44E5|nr:transcriptional regulator FilR1 domain-containing protein [Haladaptatus salinisoli]
MSDSAVYNALSELENRGLISTSEANEYRLTGIGSIIVNFLRRQQKMEELIQTDSEFWQSHDITVLPRSFQFDLTELVSGWVVRATDTRPSRAEYEVEDRLKATTSACVVEPVYDDRHITALLDNCESCRLVMPANVLSSLRNDELPISDFGEDLDIRVADVSFELAVTDENLLLSLPFFDGSYDTHSKFVADSERARNWGRKVFEQIWSDAERVDDLH